MGKDVKKEETAIAVSEVEENLKNLKEQQKQAQVTWDKCQGAIEVLEQMITKKDV